jgi:hypothetical protein
MFKSFKLRLEQLSDRVVPSVSDPISWSETVTTVMVQQDAPVTPSAVDVHADTGLDPIDLGTADEDDEFVIDDWAQWHDWNAIPVPTSPDDPNSTVATTEAACGSIDTNEFASPQPPVVPQPKKKAAFEKIEDIIAAYNKHKDAADLLAEFEKAGGKVESGTTNFGAKISFPLKPGEKPKIVLDPEKLIDGSDAVGALLFELIRWKNQKQQMDIVNKVKAGKLSPSQGAEEYEKITYEYMKQQQKIVQDAVKAGDWTMKNDRIQDLLNKFKTFEEFLNWEKDTGHYGRMEKQLERFAPKK